MHRAADFKGVGHEMSHTRSMRDWIRAHGSAVFVGVLIVLSVVLVVGGVRFQDQSGLWGMPLGALMLQLSGATLTAAIATIFFSFEDVRRYMAATVARLITRGELADLLSAEARERLDKRLVLQSLEPDVLFLEPSLHSVLTKRREECLASLHIHNLVYEVNLTDYPEDKRFLVRHVNQSYRVKAHHLDLRPRKFRLRVYQEVTMPPGHALEPGSFLKEFSVTVGDDKLNSEDVRITAETSGTNPVMVLEIERDYEFTSELDVFIACSTLMNAEERSEIYYARYPTVGARVCLRFSEDFTYDGAWFKAWHSPTSIRTGRKRQEILANGIAAVTHDWLLPGEGAILSWQPRDPVRAQEGLRAGIPGKVTNKTLS